MTVERCPTATGRCRRTPAYRLLDAGERALVVEFGSTVDPAINGQVLALDAAFNDARIEGVRETVPTYRSLMIHYDPLVVSRATLVAQIDAMEAAHIAPPPPKARWILPCCYDPDLAEDIGQVAEITGLDARARRRTPRQRRPIASTCTASRRAIAISAACRRNSPCRDAPPCDRRRPKTPS